MFYMILVLAFCVLFVHFRLKLLLYSHIFLLLTYINYNKHIVCLPQISKQHLQTVKERFQSFLSGDTQIVADEAFINAVQSYYEVKFVLTYTCILTKLHLVWYESESIWYESFRFFPNTLHLLIYYKLQPFMCLSRCPVEEEKKVSL